MPGTLVGIGSRGTRRGQRAMSRKSHGVGPPVGIVHSPYTIEGQMEGLGRFAVGASRATGWRRRGAVGMAWILPASFIVATLVAIVTMVVSHYR